MPDQPGGRTPRAADCGKLLGRSRAACWSGEYPGSTSRATAMDRLRRFLRAGVTCFVDLTEPGEVAILRAPAADRDAGRSRDRVPARTDSRPRRAREPRSDGADPRQPGQARSRPATSCTCTVAPASGAAPWWPAAGSRVATIARPSALDELQRCWRQCAKSSRVAQGPRDRGAGRHSCVRWRGPQRPAAPRSRGPVADSTPAIACAARCSASRPAMQSVPRIESGHAAARPSGRSTRRSRSAWPRACSRVAASDPRDQIERYLRWQRDGHLSATGRPIGGHAGRREGARDLPVARPADGRFARSARPRARRACRGCWRPSRIRRPIRSPAVQLAGECARTTHQSPFVVDACRFFGAMLSAALRGVARRRLSVVACTSRSPVCWSARPLKPSVAAALAPPPGPTPDACREFRADGCRAGGEARAGASLSGSFEETLRRACDGAVEPALDAALAGALAGARSARARYPRPLVAPRAARPARVVRVAPGAGRHVDAGRGEQAVTCTAQRRAAGSGAGRGAGRKRREPAWTRLDDEALLDKRFCDLRLSLSGSGLERGDPPSLRRTRGQGHSLPSAFLAVRGMVLAGRRARHRDPVLPRASAPACGSSGASCTRSRAATTSG